MKSLLILATLFSFNVMANEWGLCGHRIEVDPLVVYWDGSRVERQENVVLKSGATTNGQCHKYFIGFGKGGENVYARAARHTDGPKISYNLYHYSGGQDLLKDLPEATSNNVIEDMFLSNRPYQIRSENFWVLIPEVSSLPRAGVYFDTVRVNLYAHKLESDRLQNYVDFPIQIVVGQNIGLSLLDVGRPFDENDTTHTMNFGQLTSGESGRMDIRVRANIGHRLYLSSQNNGALKHSSQNSNVTYELSVSGRKIPLSSSSTSPALAGESQLPTSEAGDLYPVEVKIGDVSLRPAGDYRDVITVSVEAI